MDADIPLYEALLLVALSGFGLWRLKGILGDARRSVVSKRAHVFAHLACLGVGLLISFTPWGAAIGFAGAGLFPFAEKLAKRRWGGGECPAPGDEDAG